MQFFMTVVAAVTGMTFSLAFAVFVEEMVFGKVLRAMFKKSAASQSSSAQAAVAPALEQNNL